MFRQIPCPSTATTRSQTELLRVVIDEAWSHCLWEYLQLATLRLKDREYSQKYLRNCLKDSAEFNNVVRQLNHSSFRDRQVYRAWYYVRPLVIKYLPQSASEDYKPLDEGSGRSAMFMVVKLIGDLPKAEPKSERPKRRLSLEEWESLSATTRNRLLDDAVANCGYERRQNKDWEYEDVFGRLTLSPAASEPNTVEKQAVHCCVVAQM